MTFWRCLYAVVALAACLVLFGCAGSEQDEGSAKHPPGNLLAGKRPTLAQGVQNSERVTDAVVSAAGSHWKTHLTAVVTSARSRLEFDLGAPQDIRAALLQGDANDHYELSGSLDGRSFKPIWRTRPGGSGMQTRLAPELSGRARYLRVTASGGDRRYSLGEVMVFTQRPDPWPPKLKTVEVNRPGEAERNRLAWLGVLAGAFFLLLKRRGSRWRLLLGLIPAGLALSLVSDLSARWPLGTEEETLIRAVTAAVAAIVLARHYFSPRWHRFPKRWTTPTLAVLAVVAAASFYHYGAYQFRDQARDRQTLVHQWDMRVYFPLTKYFHELRYDGLYLASLAAYLDNAPGRGPESIQEVRLRNLQNNEMTTAPQMMGEIQEVRARFTPERWNLFRRDMKYFEGAMGPPGYLGSLRDHGGNATPVWLLTAYLLFGNAAASEALLSWTALLDPLLLLAMFIVVARTFGLRAMLVCLLVFGATDFNRFGSNLMGSTLRFDWMVALGLGTCALATRRYAAGGVLLAYGGLVRGFPALAAIALMGPVIWWAVDHLRTKRRLPSWRKLLGEQRGFLRAAAGGLICVGLLVGASSAVFSYDAAWGSWFQKIKIHREKPNVNHVGLRNVVSYESNRTGRHVLRPELDEPWTDWQRYQLSAFGRRRLVYYGLMALFVYVLLEATRRMRLYQAAMAGMLLVPIFFYPANYYLHYVFLLPLFAAAVRRGVAGNSGAGPPRQLFAWVSLILLVMCVAQYFTHEGGVDVVYTKQSFVLLIGFGAMLFPFSVRKPQGSETEGPAEAADDEFIDDEDELEDQVDPDEQSDPVSEEPAPAEQEPE